MSYLLSFYISYGPYCVMHMVVLVVLVVGGGSYNIFKISIWYVCVYICVCVTDGESRSGGAAGGAIGWCSIWLHTVLQ